jgi:hypothetical protein
MGSGGASPLGSTYNAAHGKRPTAARAPGGTSPSGADEVKPPQCEAAAGRRYAEP